MSSKRGQRRKACTGKIRHANQADAGYAARLTGGSVHPYHCTFCGGWHVGHLSGFVRGIISERRGRK